MIALQPAIHDGIITLFGDTLLGHLGINPVGVPPHIGADLAELDRAAGVVADSLLEVVIEVAVVQEDVGVVVPAVKVAFNGLERLDDAVELLVARQHDEGGVSAGLRRVGLQATRDEDLVIFFTDFSVHTAVSKYLGEQSV